jgi:hypothetical protein
MDKIEIPTKFHSDIVEDSMSKSEFRFRFDVANGISGSCDNFVEIEIPISFDIFVESRN